MKTQKKPILTKSEIKMVSIAVFLSLFTVTCLSAQESIPYSGLESNLDLAAMHSETNTFYPIESAVVMKKASFVGTKKYKDLNAYISGNLKYPEDAVTTGSTGLLKAHLEIKADGQIGNITILESPGEIFDQILLDLLSTMPAWNPAMKGNVPIASSHILQLQFRLQ
jgi:hypothetical protein